MQVVPFREHSVGGSYKPAPFTKEDIYNRNQMLEQFGLRPKSSTDIIKATTSSLSLNGVVETNKTLGNYTLFPFQEEGVQFMSDRKNTLLFDEMGLGKTVQAIETVLRAEQEDKKPTLRVLVICPKTLMRTWRNEIHAVCCPKFSRDKKEHTVRECKESVLRSVEDWIINDFPRFFIVNTEWVRNEDQAKLVGAIPWDFVIIDEAHRFRNPKAKQTAGILKLADAANDTRFILATGSPVVNKPPDLWPLLRLVGAIDSTYAEFTDRFCYMQTTSRGNLRFRGLKPYMREELHGLIEPIMIARRKKDVLKQLPDKIQNTIAVDIEEDYPRQWLLYEAMEEFGMAELEDEGVSAGGILALLIRLRQIALDPRLVGVHKLGKGAKTEMLLDMLDDTDEKIVVASTFTSYFSLLEEDLKEKGWKPYWQRRPTDPDDQKYYVRITGKEQGDTRANHVDWFQEVDSIKLCMLSTHIAEGITLTASSHIVFMDIWWNSAVIEQTEDRLHRIGQENSVLVTKLQGLDTVDFALLQTVLFKKAAAAGALGRDEDESAASMTYDYLVEMRRTREENRKGRKQKLLQEYAEERQKIIDHEKEEATKEREGDVTLESSQYSVVS